MKNGSVFYTSTQAITYPLLVDTWVYTQGATLNAVVINGASPVPPPSSADPVVWTSVVGVNVNGNSLSKTALTGDAGAISTQQIVSGDGYVEATASETTTYRMFGLSNGNTDTSSADIDFGLDLAPGGVIYVFEKGTNRGSFATYLTGDVMRVAVVGGVVKYMRSTNSDSLICVFIVLRSVTGSVGSTRATAARSRAAKVSGSTFART